MTETTPTRRPTLARLITMAVVAMVIGAALVVVGPAPVGAMPAEEARPVLDWIAAELDANGGRLPSSFDPSATDWGLTIDAVLALHAGGQGSRATAAAGVVATNALSYVTGTDFGSPDDRYAGALAKLLLMVLAGGSDPSAVVGIDAESELRARMRTDGAQAGRFSDASAFGDFSNGIGQALAVLALERTAVGVPTAAVDFLLAQQCPSGGFRVAYDTGDGCGSDSESSPDATAFAAMALASLPTDTAVAAALVAAGGWLVGSQAEDGSVAGNANSTGLAGAALRAGGLVAAANRAAAAVASLTLDSGPEAGAIAFDAATRSAILTDGVTDRDQLRRATTQGALGLGLSPYGLVGRAGPFDPTPDISLSAGSASPGQSVVVSGTGFLAGETVTASLVADTTPGANAVSDGFGQASVTLTVPEGTDDGSHVVQLRGTTSGLTLTAALTVGTVPVTTVPPTTVPPTTVPPTTVPATTFPATTVPATGILSLTGTEAGDQLAWAASLVVLGAIVLGLGRVRPQARRR